MILRLVIAAAVVEAACFAAASALPMPSPLTAGLWLWFLDLWGPA